MSGKEHTPEKKLSLARSQLLFAHPFYGHRAMRMKLVPTTLIHGFMHNPTAATDGKNLYYNPEFIAKLQMDAVKGLIAHECLHPMLMHHLRIGRRDLQLWNIACDAVINPMLEKVGFALPPEGVHTNPMIKSLGDLSEKNVEWVYAQLEKMAKKQGGKGKKKEEGGGSGFGKPDKGGSQGNPDSLDRKDGWGEVLSPRNEEGHALSEAEQRAAEADERIAIVQAVNYAGKQAGNIPASLTKLLDEITNPELPWRELLKRFIQTVSKNDYSWSRPNRRHIGQGLYLPDLHSNELGDIALAMDTSGSTQHVLGEFAAEMSAILGENLSRAIVIYCDYSVGKVEEVTQMDLPFVFRPTGGGGTRFSPPFDWIEEHNEHPVALIYFTDGYASDFAPEPPYPVLWVLDGERQFNPPYGDVIAIRGADERD